MTRAKASEDRTVGDDDGGNGQLASCYDPITNQVILSGRSVQVYANNSVACGQSCQGSSNLLVKNCVNGEFFINGQAIAATMGFSSCTLPSSTSCGGGGGGNPTSCTYQDPAGNVITANVGQTARFFRRTTVACGESCESASEYIIKQCQTVGALTQFVPIGSVSNPDSFKYKNCSQPNPSTCASDTTFERDGCVVPANAEVITGVWNGLFTRNPWPSNGGRRRFDNMGGQRIYSFEFTTTSSPQQYGTVELNADIPEPEGCPGGNVGLTAISISKRTPGCMDASKLPSRCVTVPADSSGIVWANGAFGNTCHLEPNTTYHINLHFIGSCIQRDMNSYSNN